jgi:dTMP kinase
MESFPGKLIAVEGLDGSGKSTQIYLLKRWLEISGYRVFFTEWNSSERVKTATKKAKKRQLLTPTTFSLIHATDFTDRYERQILPMLKAGYIVLCDRYVYTSFARDRVRGCDPAWLRELYSFAVKPDITFYTRISCELAVERIISGRSKLKYFEAGMDMGFSEDPCESFRIFQRRTQEIYDEMAPDFGFTIINGESDVIEKQQKIRKITAESIDLARYRQRGRF